jgi:hypothetical protein
MKELKDVLDEATVESLRSEIAANRFPGITFELAMQFALTNGIIPADGLPVESFLALETWLRNRGRGSQ